MVWWIKPLEIADADGQASGKFRLTAKSDEDGGGPFGLCDHEHASAAEAEACQEAIDAAKGYG